jgi:hypothetical protein
MAKRRESLVASACDIILFLHRYLKKRTTQFWRFDSHDGVSTDLQTYQLAFEKQIISRYNA